MSHVRPNETRGGQIVLNINKRSRPFPVWPSKLLNSLAPRQVKNITTTTNPSLQYLTLVSLNSTTPSLCVVANLF